MKQIKLTKGKFALVDDDMFEYLNQFRWKFDKSVGYACRTLYPKGKEYMHRIINNTPKGKQTDHINRNKLDNRKENLREATPILNLRNTGLRNTNKSGYKGIWFWKERNKWQAYIRADYKQIHLGLFKDIKDAIEARKQGEELYWI